MNNKILILSALLVIAIIISGCTQQNANQGQATEKTALTEDSLKTLPSDTLKTDELKELDNISKELDEISNFSLGTEAVGEATGAMTLNTKVDSSKLNK